MVKHIDTMSVKELRQALKQARKEYVPPVSKMKRGSLISEYVRMKQPGETMKAEEILFEKALKTDNLPRAVPDRPKVLGASEVSRTRPGQRIREGGGEKTLIGRKDAPERMADMMTMEGMDLVQMGKKKKSKEMKEAKRSVLIQTDEPVEAMGSVMTTKKTAKKAVAKEVEMPVESAMMAGSGGKQPSIKKFMTPRMEIGKQIKSVDAPISLVVEPTSFVPKEQMKKVSLTESVEGEKPKPNLTVMRKAVVDESGNVMIGEPEEMTLKKKLKKLKGERVGKEVVKIEEKVETKEKRAPSEYNKFVANGRRQGKTMAEIAFEWKNRP
jgi:hypothetical protein